MATEHLSGRVRLHSSTEEPLQLSAHDEIDRGLAFLFLLRDYNPVTTARVLPSPVVRALSSSDVGEQCKCSLCYCRDATGQHNDVTSAQAYKREVIRRLQGDKSSGGVTTGKLGNRIGVGCIDGTMMLVCACG